MKASIVIANYNNAQFINECINSLNSQTYNNIEIIFFDDNSQDNSIEIIEKFKNVKVVKNDIQTNFGSINQINAFKKSIELCTGDVIFFLDSDDYFHKSKIEKIVNQFLEDSEKMVVFDFPIILKNKKEIIKKKRDSLLKTYWGYIHPTSCISIRKEIVNKIFDSTLNDNFKDIWLDLRILLFSKNLLNYKIINDNLTYYRQTEDNVSSKFKKYSKNWWKRRSQAHEYFHAFCNKNDIKFTKNLDYLFTKLICFCFKR